MLKKIFPLLLILGLLVSGSSLALAETQSSNYKHTLTASLSGDMEVPSVQTLGKGEAMFHVSGDEREIHYKLKVENLSSNVTGAHLHCSPQGQNGPVIVALNNPTMGSTSSMYSEGMITETQITEAAKTCSPNIHTMSHLVQAVREGMIYVNVHTVNFPNGEIRGQLSMSNTNLNVIPGNTPPPVASTTPTTGTSTMSHSSGAVFAMSNATADNQIVSYRRESSGSLTKMASVSTKGFGIGVDLDTQGALHLSENNKFLYAVNAGSDDITVFAVNGTDLTFVEKVAAGDQPVSLTLHGSMLYVLNGSVAEQGIQGFNVATSGTLTSIPNSVRMLSSPIAVPGEVKFSPDGHTLLVTHKVLNETVSPYYIIDSFAVNSDGTASEKPIINKSNGIRPFALDIKDDGTVVVVEAFNAAMGKSAVSSYDLMADSKLGLISGSVPNFQTDGCWIVVTNDQRYAFTANFGSGTISSYRFMPNGGVELINGNAAFLGDKSQPVDLSLSDDGNYLYLLLRGTGGVASFHIEDNGTLTAKGVTIGSLPVDDGASGLASY
ncbi:MAG: CHRD domain-containing protein [bacterium]|nr:CHRD domain-containing protein [bacterium]